MKTIYLSGQRTFSNRGCEAIVRSTVSAIRTLAPETRFLVPSDDISRDSGQWPNAAENGVEFVQAYQTPFTRPWVHTQRLPLPWLKRLGWPFPFPRWFRDQLASVDGVLSVGGDNYSLDYRLPSLLMGIDGLAIKLGKPIILWGASVGPFEKEPSFIPTIRNHLSRFDLIGVRESVSYEYLTKELGLVNVMRMVDPAFKLEKESISLETFWPKVSFNGIMGLNISSLIERYKSEGQDLCKETVIFIRQVVKEYGLGVLLIPHVVPLDRNYKNNDANYMKSILEALSDVGGAVSMVPPSLNAAQIKYVISRLRCFIGARTHSTIAALSSGIPTISISYSIKARGINRDLFGHEDLVLPTPYISAGSLENSLNYLLSHESDMRHILAERIPEYQNTISQSVKRIGKLIHI